MRTARIALVCLALISVWTIQVWASGPGYVNLTPDLEKWYVCDNTDNGGVSHRLHTLVQGRYNGGLIQTFECLEDQNVINSKRMIFTSDDDGQVLFHGEHESFYLEDPVVWVDTPLAMGKVWSGVGPDLDGNGPIHYLFACLGEMTIDCLAGSFDCYRVRVETLHPDGLIETCNYWFNEECGIVMASLNDGLCYSLKKINVLEDPGLPEVDNPVGFDSQPEPNPFNPATNISFMMTERAAVTLEVFDISGRRVRTLAAAEVMNAGSRSVHWNGLDDHGSPVASGTYLYRLQVGDLVESNRMMLVR